MFTTLVHLPDPESSTSNPISTSPSTSSLLRSNSNSSLLPPQSIPSKEESQDQKELSALDTLSLAASAALDERGVLTSHSSVITDFTTSNPKNNTNNDNSKDSADSPPAFAPASVSSSPEAASSPETSTLRSPLLNNLTLLCDEATAKSANTTTTTTTTTRPKSEPSTPVAAATSPLLPRANSGSPTSNTFHFTTAATSNNSTNSNLLPTLSAILPQHPPTTTPPTSITDHSDSTWTYPNHSSAIKQSPSPADTSVDSLSIHPHLAAISSANPSDAYPSPAGGNYSPMSIASLTTPMYKQQQQQQQQQLQQQQQPILLPKDQEEYEFHGNKRKLYSGVLETSPGYPSNTNNNTNTSRKKRQCSQCNGWYSNLATHRSTHLADNSRPHTCSVCNRGFARPNDLFRHLKSHRGDAPFRCPLFVRGPLPHNSFGNLEPSCHQNGGFSRCDTYKNHLKAMHFEYPPGTKKKQRSGMRGKCKACGLSFESSDVWISKHIETGECEIVKRIKAMKE